MKRLLHLAAIVFLAACSASAKTFDVDISTGKPAASNEAFYHGETIEFRAVRGRTAVTNIEYSCIFYQTNGMDQAWWKTDGLVFHPTNDCGAAAYRFFLEGRDEIGRDWHANGLLRFLPSPGFEPSAVQLPVQTLDFSKITVLNPPWSDTDLTPATNYTDAVAGQVRAAIPTNNAQLVNGAGYVTAAITNGLQLTETDPTVPEWAKAPSAPLPPNYATVSNKAMSALQSFTETDPTVPAWAKAASAPLPPNYATVSNRAMTALQSYTETDPAFSAWADAHVVAGGSMVDWAIDALYALKLGDGFSTTYAADDITAISNGFAAAISSLETDISEIDAYPQSSGEALERQVAAVSNEAQLVYRLYSGSNIVCEVTNYNSRVTPSQMRLLQFDGTNGYFEVWNETNGLSRAERAAKAYADGQFAVLPSTYAPRAWSRTTSWYGADAPSNTTWISTPTTVLAGGLEFESAVTASGTLCFLACRGTTVQVYTNQSGCVSYTAADGTELFAIEKTDSYLIGVDADSIHVDGNTVTIGVPVVAESHPYVRYRQSLVGQSGWEKEEDGFASPISVSWSGSTGAYVCTVTTTASSGFFYFEYLQQGGTKLVVDGVLKVRDGILCTDGVHVAKPVYSNGSVTWQAQ